MELSHVRHHRFQRSFAALDWVTMENSYRNNTVHDMCSLEQYGKLSGLQLDLVVQNDALKALSVYNSFGYGSGDGRSDNFLQWLELDLLVETVL